MIWWYEKRSKKYKDLNSQSEHRENTKSKIQRITKTRKGKPMLLSKCVVCGTKKSRFVKKPETSGSLSSLRI